MKIRSLFWGIVCILLLTSVGLAKPLVAAVGDRHEFTIQLPDEFTVQEVDGHDFRVWMVSRESTQVLGVYAGNHPSFPGRPLAGCEIEDLDVCTRALTAEDRIAELDYGSAFEVKIRSWWSGDRLRHRELLARLPASSSLPVYVHVWVCSPLSESAFQAAERILFSFKVRQKGEIDSDS